MICDLINFFVSFLKSELNNLSFSEEELLIDCHLSKNQFYLESQLLFFLVQDLSHLWIDQISLKLTQ